MSFLWGRSRAAPPPTAKPPRSAGGRSLALVSWDAASGKFEVGEEALEALRSVPGPLGVVAVCGRARQGKSYILNQLLGRGGGFAVDSTHRPCTKGLWIWSSPLERRDEQGNPYSVVLLDTEGIDAYDQTGQYSTQIFSLALLLSSVFVYNQMGGIDEAALDRLSLVTRMSEHIRVRSEKDGALGSGSPASKRSRGEATASLRELSEFSPAFIWLLRDFYLRLEEEGRPVSPAGYLEIALEPVAGAGASAAAKNEVRRAITALFPDRDCITLVRPVADEAALARLDDLPASDLRPEFRVGLDALEQKVFHKARPRRLGGAQLTGPALALLCRAYVGAINAGAVPSIATAWEGVVEAECRRAADEAERAWALALEHALREEGEDLEAAHRRGLLAGERSFAEAAIGGGEARRAADGRWRAACAARFEGMRREARASASAALERALGAAAAALGAAQESEAVAAALCGAEADLEAFAAGEGAALGSEPWVRWAAFRRDVAEPALTRAAAREAERERSAAAVAAAEAERALGAERERASALERERAAGREEAAQLLRRAEAAERAAEGAREQARALEAEGGKLREEAAGERRRRGEAAGEREELQRRVREARDAGERAEERARELEGELERAGAELRKAVEAGEGGGREVAAMRARLARAEEEARGERERAGREREESRRGLAGMERELEMARTEIQEREKDLEEARTELQARERELEDARRQRGPTTLLGDAVSPLPYQAQDLHAGDVEPPKAPGPDVKGMTIPQIKDWLVENGHLAVVNALNAKKGKRKDWEAAIAQAG